MLTVPSSLLLLHHGSGQHHRLASHSILNLALTGKVTPVVDGITVELPGLRSMISNTSPIAGTNYVHSLLVLLINLVDGVHEGPLYYLCNKP
ncbi:hypothetical protein BDW71DRAFT_185769 [Aspergillus fruticulosus]